MKGEAPNRMEGNPNMRRYRATLDREWEARHK